jgi:hypothetical protein
VQAQKRKKGKRSSHHTDPVLGRRERVYVLDSMVVTFPTCQVERSPLKALAPSNTAPHSNKKKSKDKMGWGKEGRALFKNRISAATERRRGTEEQKKTRSWRGGKE